MSTIQLFDYSVDLLRAILWQYDNSTRVVQLLNDKAAWYETNYTDFWQEWYSNVFNLLTANVFGLSVWSIILDIPLFINLEPTDDQPIFGYNEIDGSFPDYENDYENYENGNYYSQSTPVYLTVEQQRLVLRLRYYQLVSRGDAIETNRFLKELFEDFGSVYMLDGLDMTITYVFTFTLDPSVLYVLMNYDVLPRPAGVGVKYIIGTTPVFGYNEIDGVFPDYINTNENYENGNYAQEYLVI